MAMSPPNIIMFDIIQIDFRRCIHCHIADMSNSIPNCGVFNSSNFPIIIIVKFYGLIKSNRRNYSFVGSECEAAKTGNAFFMVN